MNHPALALGIVGALLGPAHAAPADTTPPRLRSMELSLASATVSGLETAPMTVRIRLTDDTGVSGTGDGAGGWTVFGDFGGIKGYVLFQLAQGTPQDGVWSGDVRITSGWSGPVRLAKLYAQDLAGNRLEVDPSTVIDAPAVDVHSSHHPAVQISFTPSPAWPGSAVTQHVRAWDTQTGRAWPGLAVSLGIDNACADYAGDTPIRTSTAGTYQRALTAAVADNWLTCAYVLGPEVPSPAGRPTPTFIASDARFVRHKYIVTGVPAEKSVKRGTNVNVNGTLRPNWQGKTISLQRLYPGKVWRTVNTGRVSSRARFTIVATPPGKGTYTYRTYAPGDVANDGNTSAPFTIRGT
jgi:hypothetical protein